MELHWENDINLINKSYFYSLWNCKRQLLLYFTLRMDGTKNVVSRLFCVKFHPPKRFLLKITLNLSQIGSQIISKNLKFLRWGKVSQFWGLPKSLSEIWAIYIPYWLKWRQKTYLRRKYFDLGILLWFSFKKQIYVKDFSRLWGL